MEISSVGDFIRMDRADFYGSKYEEDADNLNMRSIR